MKAGDTVRWKPDYRPNGQPMPVHDVPERGFVRLDGPQGSLVSTTLLELVESAPDEDDGLMAVVEAQMAEIDRLVLAKGEVVTDLDEVRASYADLRARQAGEDEGFREEVERMLGNLCIALGCDRRPLVKTGILELDVLCRFVGDA